MDSKIKTIFEEYFVKNRWRCPETKSGNGSTLNSTKAIRQKIPQIIDEFNINSFLDIPCGDLNWIKTIEIKNYIGADIVKPLIEELQNQHPEKRFFCLDITSDILPQVDLILTKDCLVHFSYYDIFKSINNIIDSRSKYLLTTTFIDRIENKNTETGKWRPVNLEVEPFNFPKPIEIISEQYPIDSFKDKSLGLWLINDLKKYKI